MTEQQAHELAKHYAEMLGYNIQHDKILYNGHGSWYFIATKGKIWKMVRKFPKQMPKR